MGTTARGRLMLRLMLLFFTPDSDTPLTDTPDFDTLVLNTLVLDTLLQLWLLQLLLLLLLLPPLLSRMPFWEPQICPTLSTLWPTHSWELSTPGISECALTIWENRWTARHTPVLTAFACGGETILEILWKCVI